MLRSATGVPLSAPPPLPPGAPPSENPPLPPAALAPLDTLAPLPTIPPPPEIPPPAAAEEKPRPPQAFATVAVGEGSAPPVAQQVGAFSFSFGKPVRCIIDGDFFFLPGGTETEACAWWLGQVGDECHCVFLISQPVLGMPTVRRHNQLYGASAAC